MTCRSLVPISQAWVPGISVCRSRRASRLPQNHIDRPAALRVRYLFAEVPGQLGVPRFEQRIVKGEGTVLAGVKRLGEFARRSRAMMAAMGRGGRDCQRCGEANGLAGYGDQPALGRLPPMRRRRCRGSGVQYRDGSYQRRRWQLPMLARLGPPWRRIHRKLRHRRSAVRRGWPDCRRSARPPPLHCGCAGR
jgi:hypothetical protein